jgi:hypothetical protein
MYADAIYVVISESGINEVKELSILEWPAYLLQDNGLVGGQRIDPDLSKHREDRTHSLSTFSINVLAISGSNCVPAFLLISSAASSGLMALR